MIVAGRVDIVAARRLRAVMAAARRQIDLAADNRFDSLLRCLGEEFDGAEHVAMIGHCDRRHAGLFDVFEQRTNLVRAIQQTVLGMNMQMDKTHKAAPPPASCGTGFPVAGCWKTAPTK